jgi:hypothetical protein
MNLSSGIGILWIITATQLLLSANAMTITNPDSSEPPKKRPRVPNPHHAGGAEALRLSVGDDGKQYNESTVRKRTQVEKAVLEKEHDAEMIVDALPKDSDTLPSVELFLPEMLKGAIFVGHLVTDMDSVAGAIGAAALYGGTPVLASDINSETKFALDYWKVDTPQRIEDYLKEKPDAQICLVDHQQTSQMNPNINSDNVVGVIDHHALQSKTIVTDKPIYIDIRPWGSMSTM